MQSPYSFGRILSQAVSASRVGSVSSSGPGLAVICWTIDVPNLTVPPKYDIAHTQANQVTASQLTVEIEHRQVSNPPILLQTCSDCPDVAWRKWRLATNDTTDVPRGALIDLLSFDRHDASKIGAVSEAILPYRRCNRANFRHPAYA
ncbi:hypothetical protein [Bosea beijingensis]|uniref:hypothetical protein n=1 Tax=Bosea beijingensis TaxID=3068632 RepID=UPI0027422538|nr:hypothetical protein [Bosea sp. REN20]